MKSKLLIAAALIALVAAGCNKTNNGYSSNTTSDNSQQSQTPNGQTPTTNNPNGDNVDNQQSHDSTGADAEVNADLNADAQDMPQVVEVKITANGFSPSTITIKKGDYVQFTNTDTAAHWPASDPHPTHTGYPGFDALKALANGQNYRFQFEKTGSFGYHDHLNPTKFHGTVIVQ